MFVLSLFTGAVGWYITSTLKQINDNQLRITDRLGAVETRVTVLETKQDITRGVEVALNHV